MFCENYSEDLTCCCCKLNECDNINHHRYNTNYNLIMHIDEFLKRQQKLLNVLYVCIISIVVLSIYITALVSINKLSDEDTKEHRYSANSTLKNLVSNKSFTLQNVSVTNITDNVADESDLFSNNLSYNEKLKRDSLDYIKACISSAKYFNISNHFNDDIDNWYDTLMLKIASVCAFNDEYRDFLAGCFTQTSIEHINTVLNKSMVFCDRR